MTTKMNKTNAEQLLRRMIEENLEAITMLENRVRSCNNRCDDYGGWETQNEIEKLEQYNEALYLCIDELNIPTLTFDTKALANVLKGVEFKDITKRTKEVGNE